MFLAFVQIGDCVGVGMLLYFRFVMFLFCHVYVFSRLCFVMFLGCYAFVQIGDCVGVGISIVAYVFEY